MKKGSIDAIPPVGTSHDPAILKRVLFRNGEIPHVTQVSQTTFLPGQRVASHSHADMYELFICLKGQGSMKVNGRQQSFAPGEFILCEPGDVHEIENEGNDDLVMSQLGVAP